jgi:hypothetical protein
MRIRRLGLRRVSRKAIERKLAPGWDVRMKISAVFASAAVAASVLAAGVAGRR